MACNQILDVGIFDNRLLLLTLLLFYWKLDLSQGIWEAKSSCEIWKSLLGRGSSEEGIKFFLEGRVFAWFRKGNLGRHCCKLALALDFVYLHIRRSLASRPNVSAITTTSSEGLHALMTGVRSRWGFWVLDRILSWVARFTVGRNLLSRVGLRQRVIRGQKDWVPHLRRSFGHRSPIVGAGFVHSSMRGAGFTDWERAEPFLGHDLLLLNRLKPNKLLFNTEFSLLVL